MLFQLYGSTAMTQLLGWVLVFAGLVILNEIGRRTKIGGIVLFVIIPAVLTIYFITIQAGLFGGHSNQTYEYMNGWFHYYALVLLFPSGITYIHISELTKKTLEKQLW